MIENRPVGATVFGIINFVFLGVFGLIACIIWFFNVGGLTPDELESIKFGLTDTEYTIILIGSFILSLIYTVSGFGLLILSEMARKATIGIAACMLIWTLATSNLIFPCELKILQSAAKSKIHSIVYLIYYFIVIFYFTRPRVMRRFE